MDSELKAKWIAALRSGEYLQGRDGFLERGGAYCCLGVLCKVAGATMHKDGYTAFFDEEHYTELEELGPCLQDYFGIGTGVESTLIHMNDGGTQNRGCRSFSEIADWLEAHSLKTGKPLAAAQTSEASGS